MSDNNLRLQVVLGAVDKLTRPFKNAQAGSKELASAIRQTRDQIKKLSDAGGQLKSFDQLTQSVSRTGAELDQARLRAQMMTREMSSLESPTKKQTQALEAQWRAVSRLEQKQQQETRQMAAARAELYRLGLSAGGGARETARIAQETERYNRQLAEQERRLREVGERQRKLNAIKARAEKTRELRNSLAGNGAGAMAAGVTTGMTLLAPVKAYSESENAANQLAGSMMGPGGKVAPEFEKINRLAVALGDKLPGTTADFQNMMTMLRRQGMSAQVILGGLGESAAYLGVQLQMAPTAAAEFAAKLQDATQTSEKDMMNLMDVIQKGFYAGVDSGNMLQGFSKISSAMDIIHKKGLDAAKTFAPLLVMADQAGMAGESAGNAYRKIFQATLNNKKIGKANDALAGTGIKLSFQNNKGQFAGLENLYAQLEKLRKITDDGKRQSVINTLFGDDAETLQALNIMINKGIEGYRETAAKLENQASLRERVDASLNTLGNKWEAATGSFTNAMASIGETVAPALKKLADWLGELASRLDGFVKRHPQLTSALFKLAAGFAIVATAAGVVSLALASVLGPMAVVRMSAGVMGLKFSSAFGLIGKAISSVGKSIIWLGRLMFANPILAVIGLIAAGAIYIWQNWDTLGPKFKAMWDAVCNATGTAWDWIKEKASAAWEGIKSLFFNYTLPGLIAKNWDAIKSGVSEAWANIRQSISDKWNSILADVAALPAKFQDMGSAIIDSILDGINAKWETLKSKLSSVTDYLPDWMTGNNKTQGKAQVQVVGGAAAAAVPFAGMYDSGGIIPRGQFGIVGENGPEIVNGPANVTSRRRTAALASVVAGVMGVAATPAEAAPLHPYSLPTAAYKQSQPAKSASAPPVMHFETHAPITIYAQPGQSAQDIAREVARQLDERERKTRAKARSNFSDQGGYES
ncbi:phage tail tape measure protein [Salmonella enterica]|uniref:phage tail tape measure protein n=1 Tax=Salmonella enterica TaxID=28901 RepID=UPI00069AF9D6|nr:phage tail tape measure protein [Salmonella enterica]EAA8898729.1 phage tail tape measure protein [Salmonella enterica]EAB2957455.1 phage tail tape measure protein [Salmonella enterica]EAM8870373.1 phage tail tape measure protein [Salmonella enterica]EAN6062125.1 phage tail tape measure protein [Salmonella enterica]EAN9012961.1 phage tail tape measure protein [Salmonella enterica]